MAVAFDATSESHTGTTGSVSQASFIWTHTPVGTPAGVLVYVMQATSAVMATTGVTYGGVAMTLIQEAVDGAGELGMCHLYFLGSGIPTGAQTITVSRLNNTAVLYAVAATVTAATDTQTHGTFFENGDGALAERSVDDGSPGTNSLRFAGCYYGGAAPPGTGANSTAMHSIDFGAYVAATVRETVAGQGSRLVGFSAASDDVAAIAIAIREIVVPDAVIHQAVYRGIER